MSACLIGEPVRYDGTHERDEFLVDILGRRVCWVPVCPEMDAGLGTPRDPMRLTLVGSPVGPRGGRFNSSDLALVIIRTGIDVTNQLLHSARQRVEWLAEQRLCGYVLKKDSPSCGIEHVNVYTPDGAAEPGGRGLFAEMLMQRMPDLPVEEEGRLADLRLREDFIERVFAYQRLGARFDERWSVG